MEEKHFWLKLSIIWGVVIILLIGFGFYACSKQPNSKEEVAQVKESYDVFADSPDFFIYKMGECHVGNIFILVDKKTRVEYFYASFGGHRTMTTRIDSVGKPILYRGEFPK